MDSSPSQFNIATVEKLAVADSEISELLTQIYVGEGFTAAEEAVSLFEPAAVRARGVLILAREEQQSRLAGMVILVPPHSSARRLAAHNEAELQLLCVRPEYRRHGLGRRLVDAATANAKQLGCSKLILWTQTSMHSAQRLYESMNFVYVSRFERNSREFKVYEQVLCR